MKLSVSNIAWTTDHDEEMYKYISEMGYRGLEIAPTRIFPKNPYENLELAKMFSEDLKQRFNLDICSMQSIWFGKTEKLFSTVEERRLLADYTKKAIDFASVIGCRNLVFGSPKNRILENDNQYSLAVDFFIELGDYAFKKNTVLSIEANPPFYGTNFINSTEEAFQLAKDVNNFGFMVNIDFGTIIENNEKLHIISEKINFVNHIHISEPNLVSIERREIHNELSKILTDNGYDKFVSIEMKNLNNIDNVKRCLGYINKVFGDN